MQVYGEALLEICQHTETHITFVQNPHEILGACQRCLDCYTHQKMHSYIIRNKFFFLFFFFWIFIQNVTRPSDFLKEEGFNLTAFQLKQLWNILQKGFRNLIRNIFKKTTVHDSFLFLLLLFVFFPSLSGIYWSPDISPEILNLRNSVRGVPISILFLTTTQTRESFRYHSLLQHLPGWLLSIQWNPFNSLSLILILFKPESYIAPPQC